MSARELAAIRRALAAGAPPMDVAPAEARAAYSAMMAERAVAPDLRFEVVDVGGARGLWSHAPGAADDRVVLHLHGGGFVVGSAWDTRALTGEVARASGAAGLAIDYALAPEHPFPAGLDDCLAAYSGLIDRGFEAGSIAVAGDSAGGGLAISLLAAIRDAGLPQPAAAAVFSPWVDLACEGGSMRTKAAVDPLVAREGLLAMANLYAGDALAEASPLDADLSALPPLLIQVGSAEVLLDDAIRLAEEAGASGSAVTLEIWPDMIHVWQGYAAELGEAQQAIAAAGAFIAGRLGRG